jgi:hypothetical protein
MSPFILFLLTIVISKGALHIVSDNNRQFDIAILNLSESEFYHNIWLQDYVSSQPVTLPSQSTKKLTTLQSVYEFWLIKKSYFTLLNEYIDAFNTKAFMLLQQTETECLSLMYNIYTNKIYKNWLSINDVKKHSDNIHQSSHLRSIKKNTISSLIGTLSSLSISTLTGDMITPFYMASNLGGNLYDYWTLKHSETENKEIQLLTEEETVLLNEKLFAFSKIYCMNTFHLQLNYNETNNSLTLKGDKTNYIWLINLINVLISNIELRIISIGNFTTEISYEQNPIIQNLISYKEKFFILKSIVHYLSDLVSYSFHTTLHKQILSADLVYKIKFIIDEKIIHLVYLNNLLGKEFPELEEKIDKSRNILLEQRRLKKLENDLKLFQYETESLQNNFESNFKEDRMFQNLKKLRRVTWSYINILSETIDFGAFSLRNITRHCVNLVTSIPIGFVEGIGYNINDLIWAILNNLWLFILSLIAVYYVISKITSLFK